MHIQVHAGASHEPLAICSDPETMDQVLDRYSVERAEVLIGLEFPLEATVTRYPNGLEFVDIQIYEHEKRFHRLSGSDVDPGKLPVSCSSRGDVVPVQTINLSFRDGNDGLTDRDVVWVRGGKEACAHLTLYPRRIAEAGLKPSDILGDALLEVVERLVYPFMKI